MTVSTLPAENRVRLLSLDVFRGITVALMIIVNCPGNAESYAFLNHSPWNGCSLADLVFPFFLFMVGVSTVFALSASKGRLTSAQLLYRVFKRSIILFLCGLFLNVFPNHFAWETLRISGVLQRIAVCYLVAALLEISTSVRLQIFIGSVILIAYWLFMCYFPVPGFGAGNLSPQANLAAYVDRLLIPAAHLYQPLYDPEGVLSTLPAIGTTLLGCITAHILLAAKEESRLKSLFSLP